MNQEITLTDKQLKAFRALTVDPSVREVLFGGAKNGGKSFLGVSWIFPSAIMYPGTTYFIARKELGDLMKYTVPSVYEFFEKNGMKAADHCVLNQQNSTFRFHNGSTVFLLACKYLPSDPLYERFGSMQITQGWIEEGGEIHVSAYENLKLSLGRWKNDEYKIPAKLLITCNPKKNWMYQEFYKPWKEGTLHKSKTFIQSLVTDNHFRQSGSLDVLDSIKDPVAKARLRYGEWEYVDDPAELISHDAAINIFTNEHVRDEKAKKYITADIARFGADSTIIRVWRGWEVILRVQMNGARVTEVASKIRELATAHAIPMSQTIVDEDGVGGGVADILRCKGFVANATPFKQPNNHNYDSVKSQCGYYLADKVNINAVFEPVKDEALRDKIVEELGQLKMKSVDSDGKKGLMPKDKVKAMLGRSPDDLDTYIMRAWFEVGGYQTGPKIIRPFVGASVERAENGRSEYAM